MRVKLLTLVSLFR